jgi:hypothetical protein
MSDDDSKRKPRTLDPADIKTTRLNARRSFLRTLGVGLLGAAALATGQGVTPAKAADDDDDDAKTHHDFPKGSSDGDVTTNADLKYSDSDENDSKSSDSDQNRLRDVKRSEDSD